MNIKKRQEVINLMPWYNLGKLSEREKAMVDEALSEDPSLRDQLSLDQDLMSKVLADPKLLDRSAFESSSVRLDKVLAQIDETVVTKLASKSKEAVKEKRPPVNILTGVKTFFTDLLAGSSHSFTYAVFAALTAVQLALLMLFVVPSVTESDYNTANNGESQLINDIDVRLPIQENEDSGLVLEFMMKDNIVIEGFTNEKLGDLKLEILPNSDRIYRFRPNRKLNPAEIEVLKNGSLGKFKIIGQELQSQ